MTSDSWQRISFLTNYIITHPINEDAIHFLSHRLLQVMILSITIAEIRQYFPYFVSSKRV